MFHNLKIKDAVKIKLPKNIAIIARAVSINSMVHVVQPNHLVF